MRKALRCAVAVVTAMTLCGVAEAKPFALTLKASTLGLGGDVTFDLGPSFNARAGYNYLAVESTVDLGDADVDGSLDWQTIPLLLDWHPMQSGFRISLGAVLNSGIELSATSQETLVLEFDDTSFRVDGVDWRVDLDPVSWYFGIGYGDACGDDGHWHFACDFGVIYHGEPQLESHADASDARLQAALDAELTREIADTQDDISAYKFYPVISLGVSVNF